MHAGKSDKQFKLRCSLQVIKSQRFVLEAHRPRATINSLSLESLNSPWWAYRSYITCLLAKWLKEKSPVMSCRCQADKTISLGPFLVRLYLRLLFSRSKHWGTHWNWEKMTTTVYIPKRCAEMCSRYKWVDVWWWRNLFCWKKWKSNLTKPNWNV